MSLFGDKCDRCGTRTKNEQDGRPMCEACVEEMALMVQAAEEAARSCPVDGASMSKEIAHMIVIDRCPTCQGVWLDGGELDRIRGGVEQEALMAMTGRFTYPLA